MAATRIHICLSITANTDHAIDALAAYRGVSRSALVAQLVAEEAARVSPAPAAPPPELMFVD